MPTIVANGLEIAYEVVGKGPPLVLLHGEQPLARPTEERRVAS